MKRLLFSTILIFSTATLANDQDENSVDLTKDPVEFSRLYLQLSDAERAELFEAQRRFFDEGGIVPDMTAACSRWVTIGTVVRQTQSTLNVEELYFDVQ
jgi:hypothetical protein